MHALHVVVDQQKVSLLPATVVYAGEDEAGFLRLLGQAFRVRRAKVRSCLASLLFDVQAANGVVREMQLGKL